MATPVKPSSAAFANRSRGKLRITLHAPGAENFWIAPIETVSESEEGFERVYQGSQILARWRLSTQKVLSARVVWRIEAI